MQQQPTPTRRQRAGSRTMPATPSPAASAPAAADGPALTAEDFGHLVDEELPPDFFEQPAPEPPTMFGLSRRTAYLIIAGAIVLLAGIVAFFVFATILSWWPVVLDIVLVVAALTTTLLLGALIYALLTLTRVILAMRDEIVPVVRSIGETSGAVRETARAASGYAVRPAARTVGLLTGVLSTAGMLLGNTTRKRAQARQHRRQEIAREMAQEAQARQDREIGQEVRAEYERLRHDEGATS
jgi:hypothetical protein